MQRAIQNRTGGKKKKRAANSTDADSTETEADTGETAASDTVAAVEETTTVD
jgi:hypothetical protein